MQVSGNKLWKTVRNQNEQTTWHSKEESSELLDEETQTKENISNICQVHQEANLKAVIKPKCDCLKLAVQQL